MEARKDGADAKALLFTAVAERFDDKSRHSRCLSRADRRRQRGPSLVDTSPSRIGNDNRLGSRQTSVGCTDGSVRRSEVSSRRGAVESGTLEYGTPRLDPVRQTMSVTYLRLIPHLVLVAALLAGPFAKSAAAQELPTAEQLNFGFQVVHGLLESRGLKTTADLKDVLGRPRSSVLVLVGDLGRNQILVRSRIRSFLQRGGAVLLASDKAQWIDELCVIKPGPVEVEDAFAYQGYNDCPRVQRLDHTHDLTVSVRQLIANRSGWVDKVFTDHGQWHPVA